MSVSELNVVENSPEAIVAFVTSLVKRHRNYAGSERRSERRQAVSIPVTVQLVDGRSQPVGNAFPAVTKDLSAGGVGIIHSTEIASEYLELAFPTEDESLTLLAQVIHCTEHGPTYHIGARFILDWGRCARQIR